MQIKSEKQNSNVNENYPDKQPQAVLSSAANERAVSESTLPKTD